MVVTHQKNIEASAETVFSYLTNPEKMQKWMGVKIRPVKEGTELYEAGSVRHVSSGALSFYETISQIKSPNLCEYTVTPVYPFKVYRSRFELETIDKTCRITWGITVETNYRYLDRLIAFMAGKFARSALNKLEHHAAQ